MNLFAQICILSLAVLGAALVVAGADQVTPTYPEYPFTGLSVGQMRNTEIYRRVASNFGEDFADVRDGHLGDVMGAARRGFSLPVSTTELHEKGSPRVLETKAKVLAEPVTQSNYDALYAIAIFAREYGDRIRNAEGDTLHLRLDIVQLRFLHAMLFHIAERLPDGHLRRSAVQAMLDCTDIINQCDSAVKLRKIGCPLLDKGDPSLFIDNLVRTLTAYHTVKMNTKDKDVTCLIERALGALQARGGKASAQQAPVKLADVTDKRANAPVLPPYETVLVGTNEVRIVNAGNRKVQVGVRKGTTHGINFVVPPNGQNSAHVPDGSYSAYFIYENQPDSLYKGEDFSLKGNGVEIRLLEVPDGNYAIWQVR